ncbi:MAG: thiazole biosynthesis adenylyltransferase ThiF [Planctomycetes bacterium]|nr:thiazole biosynthesis adenylyltransferase ThiF [Planctomycetota bacterium]
MDRATFPLRYTRQIRFPRVGIAGQSKLLAARVVLVGCGALGAGLAEILVRSGVGHLRLVDRDIVDATNLGRQATYTQRDADMGLPKAAALAEHLRSFNPEVEIEPHVADFEAATAPALLDGCQLVLDGTDNLEARYLINDLCVRAGIPWIYGACVGASGMTAVVLPGETPCLRCLFPDPPPLGTLETCESAGIIAPVAALIASLQAGEALKLLCGDTAALRRTLLQVEMWPWRLVELGGAKPTPRADCPACGQRKFEFAEGARAAKAAVLCGRNSVQLRRGNVAGSVDLNALARRLEQHFTVTHNGWVLRVCAEGLDLTLFDDGRALVSGTGDPAVARGVFDRVVGS